MSMVKRHQKNNERKLWKWQILKKNLREKISAIAFMTFESLHSSGSRLHISDILSWKHMIGVAYILLSKDLQGSFQHMTLGKKLRYFREFKIETEIKRETRENERQRQRDRHDLEPKGHRRRWTVTVEQLKVDGTETGDNTIIWDGVLRNRAQDCRWKKVDDTQVNDTCIEK